LASSIGELLGTDASSADDDISPFDLPKDAEGRPVM
jgi:hypothetical protein